MTFNPRITAQFGPGGGGGVSETRSKKGKKEADQEIPRRPFGPNLGKIIKKRNYRVI
jgi:hypothetical protein